MLTKNINFTNFQSNRLNKKIIKIFKELIKEDNKILDSFKKTYKNNYSKKKISNFKKFSEFLIIGMGGSILGARSIYSFLRTKIKKNFYFKDHFDYIKSDKKIINLND